MTVPTDITGYQQLVELADRYPGTRVWAIEGTGGYGAGLTRFAELYETLARAKGLEDEIYAANQPKPHQYEIAPVP
jgi:hypothetical protein